MLYGLYASTFCCNVLAYMAMLKALPADKMTFFNLAFMVLTSLGLVVYGCYQPKLTGTGQKRALYSSLLLSCCGGGLLYSTTGGHLSFFFALLLFVPAYGYLAAHIARLAAYTVPPYKQGFFVGASLALANLILYFCLLLPDDIQPGLFLAVLCAGGFCLRRIMTAAEPATDQQPALPIQVQAGFIQRHLPLAVLIAAMLGVLAGLDDSIFIPRFDEYEASFFGMSRLFTSAGFLLAGVIADRQPFYLPLIAIAAKSVPLFVRAGSSEFLLSLLAYTDAFFTGALIVLVVRLFFFLAPYTTRPALWAGMGRGIELPASGLAALFGTLYLEKAGLGTIVAVHAAVLLACALLFYQVLLIYARTQKPRPVTTGELTQTFAHPVNTLNSGELAMAAAADLPLISPQAQESPDLDSLRKTYDLTERETEVLGEVLQEKSISEIAAALFVTERTVKYHIGNLLKKTECRNQRELRKKIR